MHYLTISFNHKNTTITIREKLAYQDSELDGCLKKINAHPSVNEAILLSTCNRMEIITSCKSVSDASEHIFTLMADRSGLSLEELEGRADVFEDQGAIHHLFTVASSLDSMVVGETQIAGQLKDAYRFSHAKGHCAQKISRAVHYAFKCAAEVRNVSDISSKPVSVASVAVAQAKKELGSLEGVKSLVVGAGEMSVIVAKHLKAAGADVVLINRTFEKAQSVAGETGVKAAPFETLETEVNTASLLFTSTGSQEPIISDGCLVSRSMHRYWFDIAIPRDIEIEDREGISLFRVDDLKEIVNENITLREDEAKRCYVIVGRYTMEFFDWLKTLSVEPLIKELYVRADNAARAETARAIEKGFIPEAYEQQALKMNQQVIKRFLHDMTQRIRDVSGQTKADIVVDSMKFLLGDDDDTITDTYSTHQEGNKHL
jgi:glutamyl-tRNA reductase